MFWDDEFMLQLIVAILNRIQSLGVTALGYSEVINPHVLDPLDNVVTYGVKPLASVLFSLFAVMQMYKAVSYLNDVGAPQGGSARLETMGVNLAKIGFVYWVITSMSDFMWGVVSAGDWLIGKITLHATYSNALDFANLEESIRNILADENVFEQFFEMQGALMNTQMVDILLMICTVVIFVLFYARMLQIYVMVAISPIPIVTLIHDEHKQIGISFIKSFAAAVLQGAVMLLIIYIYGSVVKYSATTATSLTGMIWHGVGYAILLVVALITSGPLAKRIVNAM